MSNCRSGCNITEAKRQLDSRLRKYKYEKRLNEAKRTDFSADLAEVKAKFAELKAELVTALTIAETGREYDRLSNAIGYTLTSLVNDIGGLEIHTKQRDFDSVQSAKNSFGYALERIEKIRGKLMPKE